MKQIPPPNLHDVLIPVLACLPSAFISPLPPPALLSYLSPILRQRISFLSNSQPTSNSRSYDDQSDSKWLHLLTWSPARAKGLNEVVSQLQLEPHPVSGEIELFEDDPDSEESRISYRRLDSETLQAKCDVPQHGVTVVWVWCTNIPSDDEQENGGPGEATSGWRVAEVRSCPCEDAALEEERNPAMRWHGSLQEAEEAAESNATLDAVSGSNGMPAREKSNEEPDGNNDDDDDDYWAAYDRTPANRTPVKQSPAPMSQIQQPLSNDEREKQYYARYGSEVQPAMDAHDPDEEPNAPEDGQALHGQNGDYSLQEESMAGGVPPPLGLGSAGNSPPPYPSDDTQPATFIPIHSPTASRPASPGRQSPVEVLEASASSSSAAEVGVKQHISTEMKSLYRLARASGIERSEFERLIQTELSVLGMLDS